jgi:hypothetical protein
MLLGDTILHVKIPKILENFEKNFNGRLKLKKKLKDRYLN